MPSTFSIKRAIVIAAPAERIYGLIDDFHQWARWSPWETLDPGMAKTFTGPTRGLGAQYAWHSTKKAGVGSMEIVEATPYSLVGVALTFTKPFAARNHVDFVLTPVPEGIDVAWIMTGPQPLVGKIFSLLFNMDKMLGKDFEKGLAALKTAAEA
jgi:hypothetical protein